MGTINSVLKVRTQTGNKIINIKDIVYLKASNKTTFLYMVGNIEISTNHMLQWFEKSLPSENFFRCHKSYIINCFEIKTYTSKHVLMTNGKFIPLSINKHNMIETILINEISIGH